MEAGVGEEGDCPEPPEPGGAAVVDPDGGALEAGAARRPRPEERTVVEERPLLAGRLVRAEEAEGTGTAGTAAGTSAATSATGAAVTAASGVGAAAAADRSVVATSGAAGAAMVADSVGAEGASAVTGRAGTGTTASAAVGSGVGVEREAPPPEALDRVRERGWTMAKGESGGEGESVAGSVLNHPVTSDR